MIRLCLSTSVDALAERWVEDLRAGSRGPLSLAPLRLVTPHRNLWKWLQFQAADRLGVAFGVRPLLLEQGLWELFQELDPRPPERLHFLDASQYRLMLLAPLLNDASIVAGPFARYLGAPAGRGYHRKAWHLAARLSALIRDYEYQRQDLIQAWLNGARLYARDEEAGELEEAQARLFHLVARPDGLRDSWGRLHGTRYATLPQYANEVLERLDGQTRPHTGPAVHCFGLSLISPYHAKLLEHLAGWFNLHVYQYAPLAGRAPDGVREWTGARARELLKSAGAAPAGDGPRQEWGREGRETLCVLAGLFPSKDQGRMEWLEPVSRAAGPATVLGRLQAHLLGGEDPRAARIPQDRSLQVLACPGPRREVEAVYQSILGDLAADPSLRQQHIAVLVADMAAYRGALLSVFGREPRRIGIGLGEFSAAEQSAYGRAFLGLLDLAGSPFRREEVFEVFLSPCFLARRRVARETVLAWLEWSRALGVFHSLDRESKRARSWGDSALYTWEQALRRMRLGRIVDFAPERPGDPPGAYRGLVPFAGLDSGDAGALEPFCAAFEDLRALVQPLGELRAPGAEWRARLAALAAAFLDAPPGRPEEEDVRRGLLAGLEDFAEFDRLEAARGGTPALTLPLVREMARERLAEMEGRQGAPFAGGVAISSMRPLRPAPFRVVYVLGLGELAFPGREIRQALDLRHLERRLGDASVPDANRYLFLEAVLSAREKLCLSYVSRDLQKDEKLNPSPLISRLVRRLDERVLAKEFRTVDLPLSPADPLLLAEGPPNMPSEALTTWDEGERRLGLATATAAARDDVAIPDALRRRAQERRRVLETRYEPPPATQAPPPRNAVTLSELARFLENPATALLRARLRLRDEEEEDEALDEPFFSPDEIERGLKRKSLHDFVLRYHEARQAAREEFVPRFAARYEAARLQGHAPDGAFAEVDRERLLAELGAEPGADEGPLQKLHGWLKERGDAEFHAHAVLGSDPGAEGAGLSFEALALNLPDGSGAHPVAVTGGQPLVWRGTERVDVLVLTTKSQVSKKVVEARVIGPFLWHLATRLTKEGGAWWGGRRLRVSFLGARDIAAFEYGDFSGARAHAYLLGLLAAYLREPGFDLLPFQAIAKDKDLRTLCQSQEGNEDTAARFSELLEENLEEDRESEFPVYRPRDTERLACPAVPADALAKARMRLGPLFSCLEPEGDQAQGAPPPARAPRPKKPGGQKGRA